MGHEADAKCQKAVQQKLIISATGKVFAFLWYQCLNSYRIYIHHHCMVIWTVPGSIRKHLLKVFLARKSFALRQCPFSVSRTSLWNTSDSGNEYVYLIEASFRGQIKLELRPHWSP